MKISKRTREQAALICAIAASDTGSMSRDEALRFDWSPEENRPAAKLANEAFAASVECSLDEMFGDTENWWRWPWAEAEALLRCGWSPT